ncbi:MAG: hypothetical protein IT258_19090 [Saprospiraceae bacterium]|nr:hypothetical protein [Saprospiraceae bacterium]
MTLTRFHFFTIMFYVLSICSGCGNDEEQQKGISIEQMSQPSDEATDSLGVTNAKKAITRPSTVLLTAHADHRLVTVYKLVQTPERGKAYLGTNFYYRSTRKGRLGPGGMFGTAIICRELRHCVALTSSISAITI